MTKLQRWLGFAGWQVLCFATAAIGAIASAEAPEFYGKLTRPSWAPPASVFGPVWTILYFLMGVAAWQVWCERDRSAVRGPLLLFVAQLAINGLWSWLFFTWNRGGAALADILLLWLLIAATIFAFSRVRLSAAALLVPYWLWVSFATALNYSVWKLNPQWLG